MIKSKLTIALMIIFFVGCSDNQILNLDDARLMVKEYYENGSYEREMSKIIEKAKRDISKIEIEENTAAIFDVDDTVLGSYAYTKSIGFGYTPQTWHEWMVNGKPEAVPHMKEFIGWLTDKNIRVIFLTGRKDITFEATKKNLIRDGFAEFDTLICRSPENYKLKAVDYKSTEREKLAAKGYKIIACFGDQESDLAGENTGIKVKLPNYLYTIH